MTMLLLIVMGMFLGFIWMCWWLGKQATKNPAAATELGVRLGKWLMK